MATATNNSDGTVTYNSDSTGQLLTASGGSPSESYSYDTNGNRTNTGYMTGANNQLLSDGTFNYTYDAEGNRTRRTRISNDPADDYETDYAWDNRNRLTSVTFRNNNSDVTKTVAYIYDAFNRWIGETIAVPGQALQQTRFVYDGNQIVMQFDKAGSGNLAATDLSHRYLWGPAVDQLLADEQVSNADLLVWTLGDNQNTIRDLATYASGATTVANHRVFSAYGQLMSQTNASAADCLFGYTGRPMSRFSTDPTTGAVTGIQNNGNRWHEAVTGRWLSEDPIGFAGGDANLYRYCGNSPAKRSDPFGLAAIYEGYSGSYSVGPFSFSQSVGFVHIGQDWWTYETTGLGLGLGVGGISGVTGGGTNAQQIGDFGGFALQGSVYAGMGIATGGDFIIGPSQIGGDITRGIGDGGGASVSVTHTSVQKCERTSPPEPPVPQAKWTPSSTTPVCPPDAAGQGVKGTALGDRSGNAMNAKDAWKKYGPQPQPNPYAPRPAQLSE